MSSGERSIGAAKGKQSDTEALCQTPHPTHTVASHKTSIPHIPHSVPASPGHRLGKPQWASGLLYLHSFCSSRLNTSRAGP